MVINKVAAFYLPSNTKSRIKALEKVKGDRPELSEVIDARIPDLERRLEYFKEPVKFVEESLVTLGSALDVVEERLSEGGGPPVFALFSEPSLTGEDASGGSDALLAMSVRGPSATARPAVS